VERLNPPVRETYEQEQQALFDPVLQAEATAERQRGERARTSGGRQPFDSNTITGEVAVEKFFPAGTSVQVGASSEFSDLSLNQDPFEESRLGLSITQALLRGYGPAVNLANIRQSRLDTQVSLYELRGFTEDLINQVEAAYWDFALATRQIQIVEKSLQVAEQQMKETDEMIQVGKLAESELVAAQVEIAVRRQELIEARSAMEVRRLHFLRLLNPPGDHPFRREVVLLSRPDLQQVTLDGIDSHVAVALKMRPDLNQARLSIQRDDLEIVKTKNGILPKMDFFITLGKSGYADSFGGSLRDVSNDNYDALAGVRFEIPFRNRAATARHRRSLLSRDQSQRALENLAQLVELDVRSAYIEVQRARQQISASSEPAGWKRKNCGWKPRNSEWGDPRIFWWPNPAGSSGEPAGRGAGDSQLFESLDGFVPPGRIFAGAPRRLVPRWAERDGPLSPTGCLKKFAPFLNFYGFTPAGFLFFGCQQIFDIAHMTDHDLKLRLIVLSRKRDKIIMSLFMFQKTDFPF
jgi:outer membrane protein TolC